MASLPSPAASPPPIEKSKRKRVRSTSGSSIDSASSNKRAVSEVPSNAASDTGTLNATGSKPADHSQTPLTPQLDSLLHLTIRPDTLEIDQYMAEQEQGTPFPQQHASTSASASLSPGEKLTVINKLKQKQMADGETWYVVSHTWYRKWEIACSGRVEKDGPIDENSIAAVDNSDIADKDGNIVVSPTEGVNVEYVPKEAMDHLQQWYGQPQCPLPRRIITQGIAQEARIELFPLKLLIYLLEQGEGLIITGPNPPVQVSLSKKSTVGELAAQLASAFKNSTKAAGGLVRYWHVQNRSNGDALDGFLFPIGRLRRDRGKLLDISSPQKTLEDALVEVDDAFVVEYQKDGDWLFNETPQASRSVTPLFGSGSGQDFFSKLQQSNRGVPASRGLDSLTPTSGGFGIPRTYAPQSKPPGTTGLVNLGNTCFMNSAIQSLAHEPVLTEYFLTGLFREELNPDNPLGMQGQVAEVFGALLSRLWVQNTGGLNSAYSPREFKKVLARFAPSFSGYQQQDAQELLAFLLDGLHEDLNRIQKKPYVEKPEWEGGGDEELLALAQKSWEGHTVRNDSVIVDLFQGQYKSTLVCPECSKVSITFDPFMYLTLPLPVRKKWSHSVYYVPWDLDQPHVQIPIELPQNSSLKDVKQLLGRWMETNPANLLTLEIWSAKFYKNLHDSAMVQDILHSDIVVCFELPCNSQQSHNYQRAATDPLIIPVFHSSSKPALRPSYTFQPAASLFGNPFVVVLSPEDVTSVDRMYTQVVDRLSRWTVHAKDLYNWQGVNSPNIVSPVVPHKSSPDVVTEFHETGEIVMVEESDIADMSTEIVDVTSDDGPPIRLGPKPDIFKLTLHGASLRSSVASCDKSDPADNPLSWDARTKDGMQASSSNTPPSIATATSHALLRSGDWLVCEWDVHMQEYYLGSNGRFEHALWHKFSEYLHPELLTSRREQEQQKKRTLNLDDCLDEFTREEKLGEDDLWYCPRCKKHQQATKKFDIWRVPDILVVHLKRFSSSRILRDKIDAAVDFPIQGLDLEQRVGERALLRKLKQEGKNVSEGDDEVDEPLLYDLFAVTEHMGGLGGGHYRAYAMNHLDSNWYHFDDSHVYKTEPQNAVNANAYLLFYRRRTSKPLGGKTHHKVKEARETVVVAQRPPLGNLPTPPQEGSPPTISPPSTQPLPASDDEDLFSRRIGLNSNSGFSSDENLGSIFQPSGLEHHKSRPSPTSSNEAEVDSDGLEVQSLKSSDPPSPFGSAQLHPTSSSSLTENFPDDVDSTDSISRNDKWSYVPFDNGPAFGDEFGPNGPIGGHGDPYEIDI